MTIGGAETLLANSLAKGGLQEHTDNYLVYFMGESFLLDRIDKRVKIIPLHYKSKFNLLSALKKLRKIITDNGISIVHTHSAPADFYTRLILPANVKMVHTVHSTYSADYTPRRYMLFLEKYLFFRRKGCNLVFSSVYNRNDFLNAVKFRGKTFVLKSNLGANASTPGTDWFLKTEKLLVPGLAIDKSGL